MKAEDFVTLEPRERDAWIAENIMDGEREMVPIAAHEEYPPYAYDNWEGIGRIVEKMRGDGWDYYLEWDGPECWTCFIQDLDDFDTWHSHKHEDPWTAVAIAAARALGRME